MKNKETLEEAGLKHCDILDKFPALINPLFSFKEGAKWMQEQIGKSEFLQRLRGTLSDAEARRLIFEQFKTK